ncbi:hypothetical protein ACIBI8_37330 [Streptomyces sp. NPDC050529]|uniref:hypothetical protein n=1 Tax=Streptomyces sp. NPDC050529 TaxID=3365624 RepID=UPI0037B5C756
MSYPTAVRRGDLAEAMLPVAAHMAALVHGDGGPEDVQETLEPLTQEQRNALIVVLAGLVDPDQPMGKLLGWLDRNEHGALTVPNWGDKTPLRDLAPEPEVGDDYIDPIAVDQYILGAHVDVTDSEFLLVLERAEVLGLSMGELDRRRGVSKGMNGDRVNRMRKAYERAGRVMPPALAAKQKPKQPEFTDAEVVEIREKYAAGGITDLELSMQYGRTRKSISCLLSGTSYRNAGGPIRPMKVPHPKEESRTGFNGHTTGPVADVAQAS